MVGELCDGDEGNHGQPAPHVVLVPLNAPQQADAAKDALGKGAGHDLRDGVGEDAHAEEGPKDGPVQLVEEGQLGPALDHQAAVGEPDEDDAEEEVEEEGVDVDVGHHLSHHLQQLTPEQPLIILILAEGKLFRFHWLISTTTKKTPGPSAGRKIKKRANNWTIMVQRRLCRERNLKFGPKSGPEVTYFGNKF